MSARRLALCWRHENIRFSNNVSRVLRKFQMSNKYAPLLDYLLAAEGVEQNSMPLPGGSAWVCAWDALELWLWHRLQAVRQGGDGDVLFPMHCCNQTNGIEAAAQPGAVPICWSCFGALPPSATFPVYGYTRLERWSVDSVQIHAPDKTVIHLRLVTTEMGRQYEGGGPRLALENSFILQPRAFFALGVGYRVEEMN